MKEIELNHKVTNAVGNIFLQPGIHEITDFWFDGDDIWFESEGNLFSVFIGFVNNIDDFFDDDDDL